MAQRFNGHFDFITAENVSKAILALEHMSNIWRIEATEGRLNDEDWQVMRKIVLERDGFKCCNCRAENETLDCHHVVPIGAGGSNRLTNLKIVCRACHEKIHPHMAGYHAA